MNLFDLTAGNYRIVRAVRYPQFAKSLVVFDVEVSASEGLEWDTTICITGTYTGPTDVVAIADYQIDWSVNEKKILESGKASVVLKSGRKVRQIWTSVITPVGEPETYLARLERFPHGGELIRASISPFKVRKNSMSYEWEGSVQVQHARSRKST